MKIVIAEFSLVVLIGPSGCGKSSFARRHFLATEIVSSDGCRALVCDDESNQRASADGFELLNFIANKRLARGRLTVIDATSVQKRARRELLELARTHGCPAVAIVFDLPQELCVARDAARVGRNVGPEIVQKQRLHLDQALGELADEGFEQVVVLTTAEQVDAASIER
ncbi:MAG: AAA family ATPase [Bradymonadaceae bacterium]|nr:AAA family ATPase [Lujinxingiaceae bacterium]